MSAMSFPRNVPPEHQRHHQNERRLLPARLVELHLGPAAARRHIEARGVSPPNHTWTVWAAELMRRTSSPTLTSTFFGLFSSRSIFTFPSGHAPPMPPTSASMATPTSVATVSFIVASRVCWLPGSADLARRPEPHGQGAVV